MFYNFHDRRKCQHFQIRITWPVVLPATPLMSLLFDCVAFILKWSREPKGQLNTQNNNFFIWSQIFRQFFQWIPSQQICVATFSLFNIHRCKKKKWPTLKMFILCLLVNQISSKLVVTTAILHLYINTFTSYYNSEILKK